MSTILKKVFFFKTITIKKIYTKKQQIVSWFN